ncbi:hypothetical protein Tco_0227261 [Tanacetum coccineum]
MYGALIPNEMINQYIKDSKAYNTYLDFATRKATPKKARKFKKVDSPSKKLSPILEEEPAEMPKQAKKPAKKSTTVLIIGVVIRDTPGVSVSKKKAPTKVDRGKGMDLLSEAALLKAAQLKKTLKKNKLETHKVHASGLGDGVGSQLKVPDESEDKTTGTDEGTDSDDDSNDDDSDDVSNDDDDDVDSDAGGDNKARCEREMKDAEHEEEGKGDAKMIDASRDDGTQQTTYEQVKDDEHVILTTVHDTQKTEVPLQSSSISSDFANQFLNLDNALPVDNEVVSMMNVKVRHEEPSTQTPPLLTIPMTVIPETSISATPTIPPTIPSITPLPQQSTPTPTPAPTTETTTTLIPTLPDFYPYSDSTKEFLLGDSIQEAFRSYTAEFEKKAQGERKRYIDLVDNYVKDIIKDEVKILRSYQRKYLNLPLL